MRILVFSELWQLLYLLAVANRTKQSWPRCRRLSRPIRLGPLTAYCMEVEPDVFNTLAPCF